MKNPVHRLVPFVSVLCLVALTAACSGGTDDEPAAGPGDDSAPAVAFACATPATNSFFAPMEQGAKDAAEEIGVDLTYTGLAAEVTPAALAKVVQIAADRKPDVLIVCNFFPDAVNPILEKAVADGITVIATNSGLADSEAVGAAALVGQDDHIGGVEAGKAMIEAGVTRPLCVNQVPDNPNVTARCEGMTEAFADQGIKAETLNLSGDQYTNITAQVSAMKGALAADPEIDGILALGPQQGPAAVQAAEASGRDDVVVGTFDVSDEVVSLVEEGKLLFAVWQQPYMQGYLPVLLAAGQSRHGFLPFGQVYTGPTVVTADNVDTLAGAMENGLG